jgi:hypothetical protein
MKFPDDARPAWNRGQLIAFSAVDGPTDYHAGLAARTLAAPDGLEVMAPGSAVLHFGGPAAGEVRFGGDFFSYGGGRVRGVLADAHHLLVEGGCRLLRLEDKLRHKACGNRLLIGAASHFDPSLAEADFGTLYEKRGLWLGKRAGFGTLSPERARTLTRALTMLKSQVYSPEGKLAHRWTTPDRWPHKDMWLWDTAFHAIGWRHVDPGLAMEMIEGMFDLQREDGFLTYRGTPDGPYPHLGSLTTQPPVLAHAVLLVFEKAGDKAWLERMYPKLEGYVDWDLQNRDVDGGGLLEWFIEDDATCRSGESGMDNSPRFDSARRLDAVDFNAFAARECEVLARMARELGKPAQAQKWEEGHRRLCRLVEERCWSERDGFYFDYDPAHGEQTPVWASSGFLPLYCGAASPGQAARLARHLRDPERFGTRVPVPSVAASDTASYSKDMWRGPMWVNVNWLIASGFERYGMHGEAEFIRAATLREIERTCEKFGTFFEYFDDRGEIEPPDLLRKGENAPERNPYRQVIHEFGWTATLYVDLAATGARAKA